MVAKTVVFKGAFGEVRKASHRKTKMLRAIKIILKETTNDEEMDKLINEVKILKGLVSSSCKESFLLIAGIGSSEYNESL